MTKKNSATPTFEVRLIAPGLLPEQIPLRTVSDTLSAVQDIASGRDPFEKRRVAPEKSIGLIDVRPGSVVYCCLSRSPDEALGNLERVGTILADPERDLSNGDGLVTALRPIQLLNDVATAIGCRIEVTTKGRRRHPLFVVEEGVFARIAANLFVTGETTIVGKIERVGGATSLRCLLRVSGRIRGLYCDVKGTDLARRLGKHLYEEIAATGTARWIHRSWKIYDFAISDFTQPRLGDPDEAIRELREAGLSAWDEIHDPEEYMRQLRP